MEKGIRISQNIKHVGLILSAILAVLTIGLFGYSDNKIYSLTSLSVTGVSTAVTTANEIIKERLLEPRKKELETLPLYNLNIQSSTIDSFVTASSSRTTASYVTARGN